MIFQGGGGLPDHLTPSGSAHGTGQCIHWLRYTDTPSYRAHRLLYDTAYFLSHAQIFSFPEFHSGLIWIQIVFANVKRVRERERETGECTSFRENQSASADRGVCVCVCVCLSVCLFFLDFVIFLTLRTRLRISKFRLQIFAKKIWSYEMSLSDCLEVEVGIWARKLSGFLK